MKIKDVFEEIFIGYNLNNASMKDNCSRFYNTLQKDSIQYTNIITERLVEKKFSSLIREKYFLHSKDIIIFVKNPYRVGVYMNYDEQDIVIPNNFIVLRGIKNDLYDYVFVANMCKADYLGSSVPDETHLAKFVKDYCDDPDGYEELPMTRFYADTIGKGIPIIWEDML